MIDFGAIVAAKGLHTGFKAPPSAMPYFSAAFKGDRPPIRHIIEGRLPRGKVVVLAGEGDVGKSWLALELFTAINDQGATHIFGGQINTPGAPCCILSAEDDSDILDNRLRKVRAKPGAEHGLIVPCMEAGITTLVKVDPVDANEVRATDALMWIEEQLMLQRDAFGELGVLVVDTWSTLIGVNSNSNDEAQKAISILASLAKRLDVCVIVLHHLSKGADQKSRDAIRGAGAIVNGARAAYIFRRADRDRTKEVHANLSEDDYLGEVLELQIVKNNLGLKRDPVTYVRQEDGRLRDVSDLMGRTLSQADAVWHLIKHLNEQGQKVTKSGNSGVYESRTAEWASVLPGKHRCGQLVDQLIDEGRLENGKRGLIALP